MKPLPTLSETQLRKAISKAEMTAFAICDEMIAAGRGHERASETLKLSDPLALRYRENARILRELRGEAEARQEWHGSLKRIRGNAV